MAYKYRSGLRPGSSKNLVIGPGVIYSGFDLTKFNVNDESTWGTLLGATKGGNNVKINLEYHSAEFDGTLGAVEGAEWLIAAQAQIETNLMEMTVENLRLKLPNFDIQSHNNQYDIIRHNGEIAPTVSSNIAVIGEITGKHLPVIFVLERARVIDTFEAPLGTGKEDVVLKTTFESRYTEENPTVIPFYILYPKGGSPVNTPSTGLAPGTYTGTQTVTLSAPSGAKIYYTTDGSIPTPSSGTLYTGPITVSATTTIKAIALVGSDVSSIASYAYIIN